MSSTTVTVSGNPWVDLAYPLVRPCLVEPEDERRIWAHPAKPARVNWHAGPVVAGRSAQYMMHIPCISRIAPRHRAADDDRDILVDGIITVFDMNDDFGVIAIAMRVTARASSVHSQRRGDCQEQCDWQPRHAGAGRRANKSVAGACAAVGAAEFLRPLPRAAACGFGCRPGLVCLGGRCCTGRCRGRPAGAFVAHCQTTAGCAQIDHPAAPPSVSQ